MTFAKWLDTLIEEKGIDPETTTVLDGESETGNYNLMYLDCLIEAIKTAPKHEQQGIQKMLVKIDFLNGDILDYFRHLAKALAY